MSSSQTVWCIGSAKFVREVSPLLDSVLRVRWIADLAALERIVDGANCVASIIEHTPDLLGLRCLELLKLRAPRTRRLVVVDACELKTIRVYFETTAATELLYRPLERELLLKACGVTRSTARRCLSPV